MNKRPLSPRADVPTPPLTHPAAPPAPRPPRFTLTEEEGPRWSLGLDQLEDRLLLAAELAAFGGTTPTIANMIPNSDLTPALVNQTLFPATAVGSSNTNTFTLLDVGTDTALLTTRPTVVITGPNASDFQLTQAPPAAIDPSSTGEPFTIAFAPSSAGTSNATVNIASNATNTPFTFALSGTGTGTGTTTGVVGTNGTTTAGAVTNGTTTAGAATTGTATGVAATTGTTTGAAVTNGTTTVGAVTTTPTTSTTGATTGAMAVSNLSVPQPATGAIDAVFTVTLATAPTSATDVHYATGAVPAAVLASINAGTFNTTSTGTTTATAGTTAATTTTSPTTRAAVAGLDFIPVTGDLNFEPGQTTATADVPILGSIVPSLNKAFALNVTGATGSGLGAAQGIGIIDTTAVPSVSVTAIKPNAIEPSFTISTSGATTGTTTVVAGTTGTTSGVAATNGTTTAGAATNGTTTAGAATNGTTTGVAGTNGTTTAGAATNGTTTVGAATNGTTTGVAATNGTTTAAAATTTTTTVTPTAAQIAADQSRATGTVRFTRDGPTTSDLTVNYAVGGTAIGGTNYVALPGSATIAAGQSFVDANVTALQDQVADPTRTVFVTVTPASTYNASATPALRSATVNIFDNTPSMHVAATQPVASSNSTTTPGQFTVTRASGALDQDLAVSYTVTGTLPNNGSVFTTLPGTVVIPAGQISATIPVTPITGSVHGTGTVMVNLKGDPHYLLPANGVGQSATVQILGNVPTVVATATGPAAREALAGTTAGNGTITIARTGGSTATPLTVNYTVGGTAAAGTDYTALSGSVTIPGGATSITVPIAPIENNTVEGNRTVVLTLTPSTGYDLSAVAGLRTSTVVVVDSGVGPTGTIAAVRTTTPTTTTTTAVAVPTTTAVLPATLTTTGATTTGTTVGTTVPGTTVGTTTSSGITNPTATTTSLTPVTVTTLTPTTVTGTTLTTGSNFSGTPLTTTPTIVGL